jgi:hypothetical protein
MIKDACSQGYVLPSIPATIYLVGLRNPEVAKLTEPIRIKLFNNGLNGEVAELTTDRSPRLQIQAGRVTNLTLATTSVKINAETEMTLRFMFEHQALTDPQSVSHYARVVFTVEDEDFTVPPGVQLAETNLVGGQVTLEALTQ